ncbi:aldo/keto reductase, partial [uncultured Dubosiella sp.]|uniref:aldo/keto reductase n=1 Tax=uncultured Dubosiella sp. TaxID=1937011 RepID=UPI0026085FC9
KKSNSTYVLNYSSFFSSLAYGEAFAGNRDKVLIQVHFGADYRTGEYGWSTNLDVVRASVEWQLEQLHTDRIDFGFIHCIDEQRDLKEYINNGVLDYIMDLKKKGIVRRIGLSTHHVDLASKVLDMGILDVLMFSGRVFGWRSEKADGTVPPVRKGRSRHHGDEGVWRRQAAFG